MTMIDTDNVDFEQFYCDKRSAMLGLATRMVDQRPVAEEIVQDAFHRVWDNWNRIDMPAAYMRTAVVSRCHDELRRRKVRRTACRTIVSEETPEPEFLADALSSMDGRRCEAIVLRYYGDRTFAEVAEVMDIPAGTAKSLVHRGLADLREVLS